MVVLRNFRVTPGKYRKTRLHLVSAGAQTWFPPLFVRDANYCVRDHTTTHTVEWSNTIILDYSNFLLTINENYSKFSQNFSRLAEILAELFLIHFSLAGQPDDSHSFSFVAEFLAVAWLRF